MRTFDKLNFIVNWKTEEKIIKIFMLFPNVLFIVIDVFLLLLFLAISE